jgi:hypothetical protein|eukprot:COSAG06_NODE_11037_length_1578_cov_1.654496_1_plen_49_part_00
MGADVPHIRTLADEQNDLYHGIAMVAATLFVIKLTWTVVSYRRRYSLS